MFDHVRGKLVRKTPAGAVIEAGGVGYFLRISLATFEKLPEPGAECRLLARLLVREDAQELVGFADAAEREVFGALISVNGVGANLALSVLSAMRPAELAEAVRTSNVAALKRVKGLGTKKADRIALELRGKVEEFGAPGSDAAARRLPTEAAEDAVDALVALGYKRPEAEAAAGRALGELGAGTEAGEIIRRALTHTR